MAVFSRLSVLIKKYPIVRGMVSYALIWPSSSIIQQTFIQEKTWDTFDWSQVAKYSLYGGLFTAPTLYGWIRISSFLWPQATFKAAVTKALVEQVTYGPAAMCCFYFFMSILENKTVDEAIHQVQTKFWPTFKVGVCFWPVIQTINFSLIPEKNRVPIVSICSLMWCCFLSYMHQLQMKKLQLQQQQQPLIHQQQQTQVQIRNYQV